MSRYFTYGVLMLTIGLSACGTDEVIEGPLGADATAEEVLQGAREAMAAVTSYRWTMDGEFGTGDEAFSLVFEGMWEGGDRFAMSGQGDGDTGQESFDYIFFEEGVLSLEDDGTWHEIPYHIRPLFPRTIGRDLAEELPAFDTIKLGTAGDHASAFLLLGTDSESESSRIEYAVTISLETLLLESMMGTIFEEQEFVGRLTTRFADYNDALHIEFPETWIPFDGGL
jgi:hypothetical protein